MTGSNWRLKQTFGTAARSSQGPIFAAFMIVSSCLLLLDRAEAYVFDQAREVVNEITAPIYEWLSGPLTSVREFFGQAGKIFDLYEENERLREEVERLRAWQGVALELERRLSRYEALLNVQVEPQISYVTGRVINEVNGPFVRTFLINIGRADGVASQQGVIDSGGLLGRVVTPGKSAARVLLLTDLNSRIPVFIEPKGHRAILSGDNSGYPKIEFLSLEAEVEVGDRVVTSGAAGTLPPGLPVGVVVAREGDTYRVKLYSSLADANFVRVLNYSFPQMKGPNDLRDAGDGREPALTQLKAPAPGQPPAPEVAPPSGQ